MKLHETSVLGQVIGFVEYFVRSTSTGYWARALRDKKVYVQNNRQKLQSIGHTKSAEVGSLRH